MLGDHRPHPRLLGHAAELGAVDRPLRAGRSPRDRARAIPGFEVEVEALNADPSPIEAVTVPQIIEHLESIVRELDAPPILIGHSAGGVFTQILLDHGYGAAGVAINSAPTEGVKRVPLSQIKATFPVLKNPANRHRAVGFTFEQWNYAFTNGFPEDEARRLYERYHIPASGEIFWGSALANIHPGKDDNWVDYKNDEARAAAVHLRQRRPPDAAVDPAVERQALERHGRHRGQGVRRPAPAARLAGLGGGRRLRAGVGRSPRRAGGRGVRVTARRRADGADRDRRLAAADGSDLRRPWPEVLLRLGVVLAQAGRPRDRGGRARADRRGPAHARPPRRQPRRRRPGAAAVGGRRWSPRRRAPGGWASARRLEPGDALARDPAASDGSRSPPRRAATARGCCSRSFGEVIGFALRWRRPADALDLRRHRALRRRAVGRRAADDRHRDRCTWAACASTSRGRCATR